MADDMKVLSYGDSLLRESDVILLEDGEWLNDQIIGFVFEYFDADKFKAIAAQICFMSPHVAQFLKLTSGQHEVDLFLAPLELSKKQYIFLPVNNNGDGASPGGSHWSLLVYWRKEKKFFHLDSCNGDNTRHAMMLQQKLEGHLKDSAHADFIQANCPQQENGYDCGMYLLCFVDEICKSIEKNSTDFKLVFDAAYVQQARKSMRELIEKLSTKIN